MNAIDTQFYDATNSGLTRWRLISFSRGLPHCDVAVASRPLVITFLTLGES